MSANSARASRLLESAHAGPHHSCKYRWLRAPATTKAIRETLMAFATYGGLWTPSLPAPSEPVSIAQLYGTRWNSRVTTSGRGIPTSKALNSTGGAGRRLSGGRPVRAGERGAAGIVKWSPPNSAQ